jgi:hypothetical protein
MRRLLLVATLALALAAPAAGGQRADASAATPAQIVARFKKLTGDTLRVDKRMSLPGHYVALDLGAPSMSTLAHYGTFTVFVVGGGAADRDLTSLLADTHTGELAAPAAGNIHWEAGTTLRGQHYWLAKRRYGANVVLHWIGSSGQKKTDASFRRLHGPLTAITTG